MWVSEAALGLGLAFSVASDLRLYQYPVGPGEILLGIWLIFSVIKPNYGSESKPDFMITLTIIIGFTVFLILGALNGVDKELNNLGMWNTGAYTFSWTLLLAFLWKKSVRALNVLYWILIGFAASVVIGIAAGPLTGGLGVDTYLQGDGIRYRWTNLSNNPNQFAMLVLVIPFLAAYLRSINKCGIYCYRIILILAFVLGVLVQSDALIVGWLASGMIMVVLEIRKRALSNVPTAYYTRAAVFLIMISGAFLSAKTWMIYGPDIQYEGDKYISKTEEPSAPAGSLQSGDAVEHDKDSGDVNIIPADRTQVQDRVTLWVNGIKAVTYSLWVGNGPGHYSGFEGPFQNKEAHNTLIDWATQTGILGTGLLLGYWVWILRKHARVGNTAAIGLIIGLGAFALFHYTLRQPLFWLLPEILLLATREKLPDQNVGKGIVKEACAD